MVGGLRSGVVVVDDFCLRVIHFFHDIFSSKCTLSTRPGGTATESSSRTSNTRLKQLQQLLECSSGCIPPSRGVPEHFTGIARIAQLRKLTNKAYPFPAAKEMHGYQVLADEAMLPQRIRPRNPTVSVTSLSGLSY